MRHLTVDRVIAITAVLVTLLVAWITLNATYDLHERGNSAPKQMKASYFGVTDLLRDLTNRGDEISIAVRSQGDSLGNLRILQTTLENTGTAPITPSDFVEPLTLTASSPWRIVTVVNSFVGDRSRPALRWHRVSQSVFRADPTLLNPGDFVWLQVYLTTSPNTVPEEQQPTVLWGARVVNLSGIEVEERSVDRYGAEMGYLFTFIRGWGIPFILISFALYSSLTISLLVECDVIDPARPLSYLWIIVGSLVNLAAADAGTTYVFGALPTFNLPPNHIFNGGPLVINAAMITALFVVWRRRVKSSASAP